jgi:transcriptional regulator with XRE-family HTH domain
MLMTVNKAVVALRKHLKQTQQRFATSLDMSISALQNYEQTRIPEAKQLLKFHRAAHEAGRDDLARVFLGAAEEALSLNGLTGSYKECPQVYFKWRMVPPRDEFEEEATDTVLRCLRGLNRPAAVKVIDALSAAIDDPERAQWFEEEAVRRSIITATKSKRRKK